MSSNPCPTYDDVNLILRLYEMRREERLREGRRWFGENFKCKTWEEFQKLAPPGSEPNASFRMVTTYWEMVASFVASGVLHREIFFESGRELLFVWERLRGFAPVYREKTGDATAWSNLEKVAEAYVEWWEKRSPGASAAFAKRVRG